MSDTTLKRLKYVSRLTTPMLQTQLQALVQRSQVKNSGLGITGILVATGGLFYQVIEGPAQAIDSLYATIAADPRHTELLVISVEEPVATRYFPGWLMHCVDLSAPDALHLEPLREILATVVESRARVDRLVHTLER